MADLFGCKVQKQCDTEMLTGLAEFWHVFIRTVLH